MIHATEFLKSPSTHTPGSIVVLSGDERSLKLDSLAVLTPLICGADVESSVTKFAGPDADLMSVRDELLTVSMWGDRRLVVVEDADEFVTKFRDGLEKYLEKPAKKSLLLLMVNSFPKTTRLFKAADKSGLVIDCSELKGAELTRWLQAAAKDRFGKHLTRDAAMLLPELAGNHCGLLDQELEKLAAYVGDRTQIDSEDVRKLVGGWKAETTWVMLNALRDDNLAFALSNLDKLLTSGEPALKLLGGISSVFRKLSVGTELARQGTPLASALQQAGVFPRDVTAATAYLRRIGRPRAERIQRWLIEADAKIKGAARSGDRLILETLFLQLSGRASA